MKTSRQGLTVSFRDVPVLFHWSLVVPAILVLASSGRGFPVAAVAVSCFVGILLAHEARHALMASRRGALRIRGGAGGRGRWR